MSFGGKNSMSLIKCNKCGEVYSDSYKKCPFCVEDEEYYNGKVKKRGHRQMEKRKKAPSVVGPVLVLPFVCAQLCRKFLPGVAFWVSKHSQISFYMWLVSLVFVIGRTTAFIIDLENAEPWTEIALGLVAMVICVVQFGVGRMLGRRYGDAAAGGQSLGQKNTVLAVWMAQSFLNPISSIAPTAYIVWQNFVNSYQIYKKDRKVMKNQI